jgi:hypothetical protein
MTHLIITNEDGECLGIERDTLLRQCAALGLTGDAAAARAVKSLAAAAGKLLLALSELKRDKGSEEKRRLYVEAERGLEIIVEHVLRAAPQAPTWGAAPQRRAHQSQVPCRSCGAKIVWLETANGKSMPVDAETAGAGDKSFDGARHTTHFATCPNANQHRQNKKAGAAAPNRP